METQWPLVLFSLLSGLGGGLFLAVCLGELVGAERKANRISAVVSLVLVIAGACFSVLHLEQPANIMAAATNVFSFSGISVELITVGVTAIAVVTYLFAVSRGAGKSAVSAIAVVGIVCGIAIGFFTGSGYVFGSQPNWNTVFLPLSYLFGDVSAGALLYCGLVLCLDKGSGVDRRVVFVALACAVADLAACLGYAAHVGFGVLDAACFWGGGVAIGCVAAGLCAALLVRKSSASVAFAGAACALVGGLLFRVAMWMVGSGILHLFDVAAQYQIL